MLSGCAAGKTNKVAIVVGDEKVTLGEIGVLAGSLVNYGYDFDTAKKTMAEQIESTLKYGELGEAMGIELEDAAHDQVAQMTASYAQSAGGLKAYKKYLKKMGTDIDFLNDLFTASAYQTEVMDKINEEIGDVDPTDDELKTFVEENYYRAKHILIAKEADTTEDALEADDTAEATEAAEDATATPEATEAVAGEEAADDLLARAQSGEDFDAMIKEYSTDPGSETNPDGYIFTDGEMVSEFEDAVKSIQPGEFTKCESDYGFHIIERLELSRNDKDFAEWFDTNKSAIESAYQNKLVEDKFNELCEQYGITSEVKDDVIEKYEEKDAVPMPTQATTSSY
jgi:parvulin-like peptidyl-prolyl isomerase